MACTARVILIGGSSHVGKTTLARRLAQKPGWTWVSTDSLARHPGRPWRPAPYSVPPHVAEHYLGLTPDELLASVIGHYANTWPLVEEIIRRHAEDRAMDRLVLEGSALWPGNVATLTTPGVSAIWLTTHAGLFAARILQESGYATADAAGRTLIEKFVQRTLKFDGAMMEMVRELGLPWIEVDERTSAEGLEAECLARMCALSGASCRRT